MPALADSLEHMGKRPGMWFGRHGPSLDLVEAFLTGYTCGLEFQDRSLSFDHFTRWVAARYRVLDGPRNGFMLIAEHVGGDDRVAFDEFFRLLPEYIRDMNQLGRDAIHASYAKIMEQIREESDASK